MRRTTILATILIIGILLITSCKPAGRAIYLPEQEYDLANFPSNLFSTFDLEQIPVPVKIYTTAEFQSVAEQLVEAIATKMCEGQQVNGNGCAYTFEPDFIDSVQEVPRYIAIGRPGLSCNLLDDTLCDDLVEGKGLIQYIDAGKLVVTGGTDADVTEAVYTLIDKIDDKTYLSGYYADIINTDTFVAVSHITQTESVKYTAKFYFTQGTNTIVSPLDMPYDRETLAAFFGANIGKINKIYLYDTTQQKYVGIYHPDTDIPSNIDQFAERGFVYVVDAKEDFELTIFGAELPTVQLAGYYQAPAYTQRVMNSFVTGAAIAGQASCEYDDECDAGYVCRDYYCVEPTNVPEGRRCVRTENCQSGLTCINNICTAPLASEGQSCEYDEECQSGLVCRNYYCVTPSTPSTPDVALIYSCRRSVAGLVYDHYIVRDSCGDHLTQRVLGRMPATQPTTGTTVKLLRCEKTQTPYQYDMVVRENACLTNENQDAVLGYAYPNKPTGITTSPISTCSFSTNGEHFVIDGETCPVGSEPIKTYWILPFCVEEDDGKDTGTQGSTYSYVSSLTYSDSCADQSAVIEYYCDSQTLPNGVKSERIPCEDESMCINSVCVAPGMDFTISKTSNYDYINKKADYTITVRNIGQPVPEEANIVNILDYFPGEWDSLISITPEPSLAQADKLIWAFEEFGNADSETYSVSDSLVKQYSSSGIFNIQISVALDPDLENGVTVTNTAQVKSQTYEKNATDTFTIVAPTTLTLPVYRCWHQYRWDDFPTTEDHYLSFDESCGDDNSDGLIGHIYVEEHPNTQALYQCYREHEHTEYVNLLRRDHTYRDHFTSTSADCEGFASESIIGYLPTIGTEDTKTVYRCWDYPDSISDGRYDHMVSTDPLCEYYNPEGVTYNFFKEPVTTSLPTPTEGGAGDPCTTDEDCVELLSCLVGYCSERNLLYNCYLESTDEYYPSNSPDCLHPVSSEEGTGELIAYLPNYLKEGMEQWGICIDETSYVDYDLTIFYPSTASQCDTELRSIGTIFRQKQEGTTELYARSGPPVQLDALSSVTYKYYYTLDRFDRGPDGYSSGYIPGFVIPLEEPGCGNGIIEPPETCDDGNLVDGDGCDHNCQIEADITPGCGNGVVEPPETCDDGNLQNGDGCDSNCQIEINITPTIPGVPPLVPPPVPPTTLPPFPHQFYGNVINSVAGMSVQARLGTNTFSTVADAGLQYGYSPIFFVTGTTNGAQIAFYVNNSFDQTYPFQQGAVTNLDLTYTAGGAPIAGTCSDNVLNQDETDIDCGGTVCPKCPLNNACTKNADCKSGYCKNNVCKTRPVARVGGGGGGGGGISQGKYVTAAQELYGTPQQAAVACSDDWICDPWGPCLSGMQVRECFLNDYPECILQLPKPDTTQSCVRPEPEYVPPPAAPNCFDGIQNQDETFPDCGGSMCKPCDPNLPCATNRDCITNYCEPVMQMCSWPPVVEEPKPPSRWWIWLIVALAAIGVIGGTVAAIILLKKKGEEPPNHRLKDLKEYVDKYKKKGVSAEKIRQKVIERGWKKDIIDQVLK